MSELHSSKLQQMADKQVADMNREMAKRAMRNIVIFAGIKIAIAYGLHRWAKAAAQSN